MKTKISTLLLAAASSLLFVVGISAFAPAAHALSFEPQSLQAALVDPGDRPSDAFTSDFRTVVVSVINYLLGFLGLLCVAFFIYAGFLMITDQGEGKSQEKAKKIITFAAVGIVLILASYAIVNVIVGVKNAVA